MPKISAPTVAEHRSAQRRAIIAAAEAMIREHGVAAVTPRSVGERTGLARSSFYEYFPSRDDLLAAIALQAFDDWAAEISGILAAAPAGRPRLHAYVEATIRMAADGKHSLATDLQQAELSPKSHDTIRAMHDSLDAPLRDLLAELAVPDPGTQAVLIQGLIGAGVRLVGHGADANAVTESIVGILDGGVPT